MRLILISLFFVSCSSVFNIKPKKLDKFKTVYQLKRGSKGIIYNRFCEKKDDECTITEYNIIDDWDQFSSNFIIAPFDLVF